MLRTAILFQDHMVLQRDKEVTIWGTVNAGAQITVTMQGKVSNAVADEDGNWKAICGPYAV